jgi:tetrahydromethanopterin S-methyltransferase subunit G
MAEPIFEKALKAANDELENIDSRLAEIETERIQLTARRANLQETATSLSALLGHEQPVTALGLTAACREVVKGSEFPLSAQEVRDQLETIRFDFSSYGNQAISAVNTALNRLAEKEVLIFETIDGKKYFLSKPQLPPPPGYIASQVKARAQQAAEIQKRLEEIKKALREASGDLAERIKGKIK